MASWIYDACWFWEKLQCIVPWESWSQIVFLLTTGIATVLCSLCLEQLRPANLFPGCTPTILPTVRLSENHNGEECLYAECACGQWYLHCGPCHCSSSSCVLLSVEYVGWHQRMSPGIVLGQIPCSPYWFWLWKWEGQCVWFHCTLATPYAVDFDSYHSWAEAVGSANQGWLPQCFFFDLLSSPLWSVVPKLLRITLFPFQSAKLPQWLFQHFLVRTAGPKTLLDTSLLPRSLL